MAIVEVPGGREVTTAPKKSLLERAQERVRQERENAAVEKLVVIERKIADARRIVQNFELERQMILKDLEGQE